ncbi:hypothetical protein LUZ61_009351 [Rhynchospora tenuis]|uniref:PsbP C-terminal domain-containing protein n=1 Tax=Rhynchospora tenuis TaxID=198213 RepID=A0AAD5ZX21_9POAL|nr:hypothetical protein LUZ61_009351 [Rhynchospora tenuis]
MHNESIRNSLSYTLSLSLSLSHSHTHTRHTQGVGTGDANSAIMSSAGAGACSSTASASGFLRPSPTCVIPRRHVCAPQAVSHSDSRRRFVSTMLSTLTLSPLLPLLPATASPSSSFKEHIDNFDGYTFFYPRSWIQVRGAGADIFFRDPLVLDENISVEISSPSSSKYKSVEDLGSPEDAAQKVLRQYLTELMSTRLGVKRESNVLTASQRVADDGRNYYQVEVNIKSYASNNELAVMPEDRVQKLEWDRRYLSVLGVENKRLYELRLQSPEKVFMEEERDLREVMDSFRVFKAID